MRTLCNSFHHIQICSSLFHICSHFPTAALPIAALVQPSLEVVRCRFLQRSEASYKLIHVHPSALVGSRSDKMLPRHYHTRLRSSYPWAVGAGIWSSLWSHAQQSPSSRCNFMPTIPMFQRCWHIIANSSMMRTRLEMWGGRVGKFVMHVICDFARTSARPWMRKCPRARSWPSKCGLTIPNNQRTWKN